MAEKNAKAVEPLLCCPECEGTDVAVTEETMWMVNGGEHYCHSVKAHDSDAKTTCLHCRWEGQRSELKTKQQVDTK